MIHPELQNFNRLSVILMALTFCLLSGRSRAQDAGALPLRPGEPWPPPLQRGLDEIQELPTEERACPVCNYPVKVPLVDTLIRRPAGRNLADARWRMHFIYRDDDLCPYPGRGKVNWQADVVVCPSCGHTDKNDAFADPLPEGGAEWVASNLTPALHSAQRTLLGARASEMREEEIVEFFNRQDAIPDTLRTEFRRTCLSALQAPPLEQAEAAWTAAWAARRETAAPPRGEFLAKHCQAVRAELALPRARGPGLHGEIDALRAMLRRGGRQKLPEAQEMAGRLLLAGMLDRLGFLNEAEAILQKLYHEFRERFLHHEQDPLWSATTPRAPRTERLNELEAIRADAEDEVFARMEQVRRERDLLADAASHIRDAIQAGDFDANPDQALFHAYLLGEFLRRSGDLPLASEWFKNLLLLAEPDSDLAGAASRQLQYVNEEAAEKVNLLSALGRDGILFERLRSICEGAEERQGR